MEKEIPFGIKRKCWSINQIKSSKRKRLQGTDINIVELSDCTLLHLLQFLDATSLYQLGKTCTRFKRLVQDESLWIHVDGRSEPNDLDKSTYCWQNAHKRTERLLLAGKRKSEVLICLETLFSEKLSNLTILALENQHIKYCTLTCFPNTLQELSFKNSYISKYKQFFRFSHTAMDNLKTLILDHCQWFQADCLTSICKYPQLEILSLYMCKKLSEDDISSISVAGKYGFKSLRVVDLRFTGIGDLFIKSFYAQSNIQIVYFQCFPTTYYLDRYQRKWDIINGKKMREHSYISDDEANNDTSKQSLSQRFNATKFQEYNVGSLRDDSMVIFNRIEKTKGHKTRPKSYLYIYPYGDCTCGFFDAHSGTYGFKDHPTQNESSDESEVETFTSNSEYKDSKKQAMCLRDCCRKDFPKGNDKKHQCSSAQENENTWDRNTIETKLKAEIEKQKHNRHGTEGCSVYFMLPTKKNVCNKLAYDSCTNSPACQLQSTPRSRLQSWLFSREPRNDYEIAMLEHTDKHYFERIDDWRCDDTGCNCNIYDGCLKNQTVNYKLHPALEDPKTDIYELAIITGSLISELNQGIERIRINSDVESQAMIAVKSFLEVFHHLNDEELSKCVHDDAFLSMLCNLFCQLAQTIKHHLNLVLHYHITCFEQLVTTLQLCCCDIARKKDIIKNFFNNFLYSEGGLSSTYEENACVQDLKNGRTKPTDDNWNLPGPSGTQLSSETGPSGTKVSSETDQEDLSEKPEPTTQNNFSLQCGGYFVDPDAPTSDRALIKLIFRPENFGEVEQNVSPDVLQNIIIRFGGVPPVCSANITELSCRGYSNITNKTLKLLKEMNLDLLDVTGTNVTSAGVTDFMLYNPQCRLIHESACICRPNLHF